MSKTKRILFKCKGNICRSPAAEIILRAMKPEWQVFSCATTPNTTGQKLHPGMKRVLEYYNFPISHPDREVIYQDDILEFMPYFDEIHDLHLEGISDPYITGHFNKTVQELIQYIETMFMEDEECTS
jgi:hypothetical protein